METQGSQIKALGIGIGVIVVVIIVVIVALTNSSKPKTGSTADPQQATTIHSAVTDASDGLLINYSGSIEPDGDAVNQPLRLFAEDEMPLPEALKTPLLAAISDALRDNVVPSYVHAYVQINRSTIQCATAYDCKFSFYLDSPESYYDFHYYLQANGSPAYTIKQQPLPEVRP
jgi:hypothetical protein